MRSVIVTGGGSGLGLEIVKALARPIGDQPNFKVTSWDLKFNHSMPNDVSQTSVDLQVEDGIEAAARLHDGPVYAVINCAGVNHLNFFEGIRLQDWDKVMNVNVRAPWLVVKHLLLAHKMGHSAGSGRDRGTVVNIISNASHKPMTLSAVYNASKGALHILTLQMARELMREHGMTVFGISPNRLRGTAMSLSVDAQVATLRDKMPEQVYMDQVADMPAGLETSPTAVADLLAFLLSNKERHRYLHGTVIPYGA